MVRSLTELKEGEKGVVIDLKGGERFHNRLSTLGVRVGALVTKVSSQVLKGPVIINVGSTQVAVGYKMAMKILVSKKPYEDEPYEAESNQPQGEIQ